MNLYELVEEGLRTNARVHSFSTVQVLCTSNLEVTLVWSKWRSSLASQTPKSKHSQSASLKSPLSKKLSWLIVSVMPSVHKLARLGKDAATESHPLVQLLVASSTIVPCDRLVYLGTLLFRVMLRWYRLLLRASLHRSKRHVSSSNRPTCGHAVLILICLLRCHHAYCDNSHLSRVPYVSSSHALLCYLVVYSG